MREELQSHLQIRNWMMELADMLIPDLKQRVVDEEGNYARYISVHDLKVDYDDLQEVIQFYCRIHYLSDIGDFEELAIIRYFHSLEHYAIECAQYDKLLARTNHLENIKPVELILRNDKDQALIYLSPKGRALGEIQEDEELFNFQIGYLMAVLHGSDIFQLETTDYYLMAKYLLNNLGFDEQSKNFIEDQLESEFLLLKQSYSGYEPVSIIDLDYLRFLELETNISKRTILSGEAYYIEVLPSFIDRLSMDRMEDFATFFAKDAFWEFVSSKSVDTTVSQIISAMEGYESYFNQYATAPMDIVYPNGLSLDLHMLLGIWLFALDVENTEQAKLDKEALINYSIYVLEKKPFQIYEKK